MLYTLIGQMRRVDVLMRSYHGKGDRLQSTILYRYGQESLAKLNCGSYFVSDCQGYLSNMTRIKGDRKQSQSL